MKIVTIDFDIIMTQSISLYNNTVPSTTWDTLLKDPIMNLLPFNSNIYSMLTLWLQYIYQFLKAEQIYFIESHETVAKIIQEESLENIELINIDHHHDLGYSADFNNDKKMHCGNWVKKLFDEKRIKEYIWIKNDYSLPPKNCNIEYIEYDINDIVLTDICDDCDKIFICLSSAWIPPYYVSLFTTWIGLYELYYQKEVTLI